MYLNYEEAVRFLSDKNLNYQKDFKNFYETEKLRCFPKDVYKYYKNKGWTTWSDFLSSRLNIAPQKIVYMSFVDAKEYVKSLKIKTLCKWIEFTKINTNSKLPSRPDVVYKSEWISWSDFLKNEIIEYYSYSEAVKIVRSNKITDRKEYLDLIDSKNIINLPRRPDYFYKEKGWSGWLNFTKSNKRLSIGEYRIKQYLDLNFENVEYYREFIFKSLPSYKFDFYIPEYNMCIEFDGIQHFEPVRRFGGYDSFIKIQNRDKLKNEYCLDNNIKMVRISYKEIDNIDNILLEVLNN